MGSAPIYAPDRVFNSKTHYQANHFFFWLPILFYSDHPCVVGPQDDAKIKILENSKIAFTLRTRALGNVFKQLRLDCT